MNHSLCANTIRGLAMDAVQAADSGHPGMPMGTADMATVLWTRFLKHDPADPQWPDRDRFVLSAGHGSALLYSLLHLSGYPMSLDDLRDFRQWGSQSFMCFSVWGVKGTSRKVSSINSTFMRFPRSVARIPSNHRAVEVLSVATAALRTTRNARPASPSRSSGDPRDAR